MEEPSASLVWRDWILASCLAAAIGVGSATAAAVVLFRLFDDHWFRFVGSGLAFTLIGGLVIGVLQYRVLSTPLPFLHGARWVGWTVVGSGLAWAAVFLNPLAGDLLADDASEWWLTPELSIVLGAAVGLGVGLAQMVPLREWVVAPWRWMAANTLTWAAATPLLWLIADRYAGEDVLQAFPASAGLLLVAGLIVGLVEGWVVGRLGRRNQAADQYTRSALGEIGSIDLTE